MYLIYKNKFHGGGCLDLAERPGKALEKWWKWKKIHNNICNCKYAGIIAETDTELRALNAEIERKIYQSKDIDEIGSLMLLQYGDRKLLKTIGSAKDEDLTY